MSTLMPSSSSRTSSPTVETTPSPSQKAPHNISSAISKDNIILGPHIRKYAHPDSTHVAYALPENHIIDPIANDPLTVEEAKSRPDWPQWKQAMDDKMGQLRKLGTFSHTPLPADRTTAASKWVFRVKHDKLRNITHYKARLVAEGFSQIPGIDYDETIAPVVCMETVRLLLALPARYKLEVHIIDVIGAYLNGKLDQEIYMQQPEGYQDGSTLVWKLHKALYSLKQSGSMWNIELNSSFLSHSYTRLLSDQ
jgi:hypothetical protein